MKYLEHKPLYVLEFQKPEMKKVPEVSFTEHLAGWFEAEDDNGETVFVNEWHQAGSLSERYAKHILAWRIKPGNKVVAVLNVDLEYELTGGESFEQGYGRELLSVYCDPRIGFGTRLASVVCGSVLGRAVSLGEDGAEDAFGNDALRDCLESLLYHDDQRGTLCEVTFDECGWVNTAAADDKNMAEAFRRDYDAWLTRHGKRIVNINKVTKSADLGG